MDTAITHTDRFQDAIMKSVKIKRERLDQTELWVSRLIFLIFSNVGSSGQSTIINADTNNYLWDSALQLLNPYSLKITDFDGGYIETDWIMQSKFPNQRCLIKSHITSMELVSNGINIKIICEELVDGIWYISSQNLQEEEKQLTLKILNQASKLSNSPKS